MRVVHCTVTFIIVTLYLQDGIGMTGANLDTLFELQSIITQLGLPFIIVGDWNVEPATLMSVPWYGELLCETATPSNTTFT